MWDKVASRSHRPLQLFPFGANPNEFMLFGTVEYGLKAGGSSAKDWAARAILNEEDAAVKMSFYQVYLVRMQSSSASWTPPLRSHCRIQDLAISSCRRRLLQK